MHLYLLRHGQFIGNTVPEDTPDGPLTDKGRLEAQQVGAYLSQTGITRILASPLMRGLETATAVASQCGLRFTAWKETYEYRDKGLYIGPTLEQLRHDYPLADFESDMEPAGWVCGGVETPEDVITRAQRVATRLRSEFAADDKVVLVGHGGFNSVLLGVLLGISNPHAVKFRQKNCCINLLRIETDHVAVHEINATGHISEDESASIPA